MGVLVLSGTIGSFRLPFGKKAKVEINTTAMMAIATAILVFLLKCHSLRLRKRFLRSGLGGGGDSGGGGSGSGGGGDSKGTELMPKHE